MIPEFSRPVAVVSIPPEGRVIAVEASPTERALLAARFGLPSIEALACRFALSPLPGSGLSAEGTLAARVHQVCVVSGEAFEAAVTEDFSLRFVPPQALSADIEVDGPDHIPIAGSSVDLGEAAAEQLALALDPCPRSPALPPTADADEVTSLSPFAALGNLQ
jgi:uncharacterized metal-binding protein YceD (DUF177 family)